MAVNLHLVGTAPRIEKQRVARAGRKSDASYGRDGHKYLTPDQVEALVKAARSNRYGQRDALMISLAWHHGLRASELIGLRWSAIDWKRADIAVTRLKNGKDARQPLDGNDLRALRALYRDRTSEEWVFMSERGPFTRDGFAKMLKAAADRAGVENVHPHALRHACGHALAMKGRDTKLIQDYLGHRNIQHTSLYTDGVSTKFKGIWD
ncbi:MAG TPA: tyrosine-type recombinase/integrase [Xanthobacteraceae bacterium]|jgi:type 1 fimbriae regulatory protein FimB/type 1 fimbriae regulatory protein FimE